MAFATVCDTSLCYIICILESPFCARVNIQLIKCSLLSFTIILTADSSSFFYIKDNRKLLFVRIQALQHTCSIPVCHPLTKTCETASFSHTFKEDRAKKKY